MTIKIMNMKLLTSVIFLLMFTGIAFPQDTTQTVTQKPSVKEILCRKWLSVSYTEDGKKGNDFYVFMEFQKDGRYTYIEDDEPIKEDTRAETGTWELLNDNIILFDKGTDDEDRMSIVSIDEKGLNVNYSFDKVLMNISFVPGNYK